MTVPNLLTLGRVVLVPVFVIALLQGTRTGARWALALFVIASLTDLFDGLLARKLGQQTRLGALLDPIADKALLLAAYLSLWHVGVIPLWLLGLVLLREAIVAVGTFVGLRLKVPHAGEPSRLGKQSTFMQLLTLGLALFYAGHRNPTLADYLQVVMVMAAVLSAVSAAQYGSIFANRPPSPQQTNAA